MAKLSEQEIDLVLKKIKNKYEKLISEFKKSRVLLENFEDRYLKALKSRFDITTFLMAEIEALDELFKKEEEKKSQQEKEKSEKINQNPTIADKVYEENKKRILKYIRVPLNHIDSDEDLERLFGAVREFINDHLPSLEYIYRDKRHSTDGEKINFYTNKFLSNYDYKGEVPISRQYLGALERIPKDYKKIEYEHNFAMKETAFLLNELLDVLEKILKNETIPLPENKILLDKPRNSKESSKFYENYNGLVFKEAFQKTINFLGEIIHDFRFKNIKKSHYN